jgi:hypothetical protein
LVPDHDAAGTDDVRTQAGAVDHPAQHTRLRERLQVVAGLAELDAHALGLADRETPTDERVEVDAAGGDVAARLARCELDTVLTRQPLDRLGLDQCQITADAIVLVVAAAVGVAIAVETDAGDGVDGFDGLDRCPGSGGDVDVLDDGVHCLGFRRRVKPVPCAHALRLRAHGRKPVARRLATGRNSGAGVSSQLNQLHRSQALGSRTVSSPPVQSTPNEVGSVAEALG